MEADLINVYVEQLNDEVASLTKIKCVLQARLTVSENEKKALEEKVLELENKLKKKPVKTDE